MEHKIIADEREWKKYLEHLDRGGNVSTIDLINKIVKPYSYEHNGVPERYPCLVISNWWDDPNGPYTYEHEFLYYDDVEPLVTLVEDGLYDTEVD